MYVYSVPDETVYVKERTLNGLSGRSFFIRLLDARKTPGVQKSKANQKQQLSDYSYTATYTCD